LLASMFPIIGKQRFRMVISPMKLNSSQLGGFWPIYDSTTNNFLNRNLSQDHLGRRINPEILLSGILMPITIFANILMIRSLGSAGEQISPIYIQITNLSLRIDRLPSFMGIAYKSIIIAILI